MIKMNTISTYLTPTARLQGGQVHVEQVCRTRYVDVLIGVFRATDGAIASSPVVARREGRILWREVMDNAACEMILQDVSAVTVVKGAISVIATRR